MQDGIPLPVQGSGGRAWKPILRSRSRPAAGTYWSAKMIIIGGGEVNVKLRLGPVLRVDAKFTSLDASDSRHFAG